MPSSHHRTSALVILGLILLSPSLSAAEIRGHGIQLHTDLRAPELSLGKQLWGIVSRLWGQGASADPKEESQPAATGSLIKCDNGGSIDPDGHCRP